MSILMTDIYKLFDNELWLPDDFTECIWYRNNDGVHWGDDIDDLMNGEEDTYFCEIYSSVERDGYILYTLYNGCGEKCQSIFKLDKEVSEEDYWKEKYLEESEDD